jgi:hypothetical protein
MKDIIKYIPISTILLTYLFVCGSLYLIGFWSTFDINVFSFISIYDIPKNFVYPLMISQAYFVVNMVTGQYILHSSYLNNDSENIDFFVDINEEWSHKKKVLIGAISSIPLWIILVTGLLSIFIENHTKSEFYWTIVCLIFSYYLLYRFVNLPFVKSKISNVLLRYYIGHFLTFFPIACFSNGKTDSLKIYLNQEKQYFDIIDTKNKTQINDPNCLKFLGFVSDKYIYSSLDNHKIYILNKEECNGIEIIKN